MATYSFLNIQAAIIGPGGAFPIGSGSGVAEEGISVSMADEKDLATAGADGTLMHSLRASNIGKMKVSLLKTSPANNLLSALYNLQRQNPALWGQNVITLTDVVRGDFETLSQAAFLKQPDNAWDKDGKMIEWEFIGNRDELLGAGVPDVNL